MRLISRCLLALGLVVTAVVPNVSAAVLVVDRTSDGVFFSDCSALPDDCSLRGAIVAANNSAGADEIVFDPALYPSTGDLLLQLTTPGYDGRGGDLDIDDDLTINGLLGSQRVRISAQGLGDRVIDIDSASVTLIGLIIEGGSDVDHGGGIKIVGPSPGGPILHLISVTVRSCSAIAHSGGIAANTAKLVAESSTISGNSCSTGSAIASAGIVELHNCTISNNIGLYTLALFDPLGTGTNLKLDHVTIADNVQTYNDCAINFFNGVGTFTPIGSIVDGNCCGVGTITTFTGGGNVISSGDHCGFDPAVDQLGVADLGLLSLGDYGGLTQTLLPRAASPAVDDPSETTSSCPASDQRGFARNVDGNGDGLAGCDAGAVERQELEDDLFVDGFESGDTSHWSATSP